MDAHFWLFPWLSLFASFIAAIGGVVLSRRSAVSPEHAAGTTTQAITPSLVIVWLLATTLMVLGGLKLGDWASIDYVPARGVLAGALGGAIISLAIRQRSGSTSAKTASTFGFATALISASWLWLTHGEVSGLIAVAFSAGVAILCFVAAPNVGDDSLNTIRVSTLTVVYTTTLTGGVLLGFTRAGTLGQVYWADIPLMIGAALSVGLLIAASLERFGVIVKGLAVLGATLIVLLPLGISVAHLLPVIGLTVLGAFAIALPLSLVDRTGSKELPIYLGFILLISGVTLSFTLLSGYGVALFALGSVVVGSAAASGNIATPINWLTFGALLLVYRLEILQNGSSVRAIGPADLWDLLAIGLGILLPKIVASWITDYPLQLSRSTALQWLLAISIPTLVLDYIWQPRSLTGLFLGLSIGQMTFYRGERELGLNISAITSLLVALLLFLFLPGLDVLTAPSRETRIVGVAVLATLVVIRIVVHPRRSSTQMKAE